MIAPSYQEIVRDEALIVSVVSEDFPLRPSGSRWKAAPGSGTDTLNVFRGRDGVMRYKRYGTDQGGTVFEFLKDYRGIHDRAEALRVLGYGDGSTAPRRLRLPPRRPPRPAGPPAWQVNADAYLARYTSHPKRYALWQAYRPFWPSTIDKWRLGVGVLPMGSGECRHERLILPVMLGGVLKGFRGRVIDCSCTKWLGTKGSEAVLFGSDQLRLGLEVIVTEAPISVILAAQEQPGVNVVAGTAGAGTWLDAWTAFLVSSRVPQVVVWFDNDLAGGPNPDTYEMESKAWREKWTAKHPGRPVPDVPKPAGPRVMQKLAKAGLDAITYTWPPLTPLHADFDQLVMARMGLA
jgi:hypothetical protein